MRQKLPRAIGTLGLVFVLFFSTSGGPYTTETLIHSVGPGLGLLILALVPLIWSVPEALIVGELASMLPEEGGYYRWVDRAFGRFWAFQNGWLTWMYSLVDMAIYPVLFNQYLRYFIPGLDARVEWLISLAIIWGAAWINVRGSVNVTRVSIIAGCFIMFGFLALSVASVPRITHIPWQPFASEHARGLGGLAVGISIALWNYIGWDNPSTVQGEVKDPSRTYPRALAFALPLVTIGYFVPLLTTLGASDWTTWTEGGWPQIAASAAGSAGRWLAIWIALGGMISALALFNALLLGYSRIPFVLAGDGLLPKPLAKLDVHGHTADGCHYCVSRFLFAFRSCRVRQTNRCRCASLFGCALPGVRRADSTSQNRTFTARRVPNSAGPHRCGSSRCAANVGVSGRDRRFASPTVNTVCQQLSAPPSQLPRDH